MKRFIAFALLTAAASFPAAAQEAPPDINMQELMKAMGQVMGGATNAAAVTVDFRALKALLPAELTNMKRTNASGEKTGMMGMTVVYAEGAYQDPQGATIDIKITDMGGMGAMSGFAKAGWGSMEIDRESDDGYERTTTIKGHKAYEKYETASKSGQIQIMVGERFMVEIQGNDVPVERLKEAMEKIDLAALVELKPAEAAPAPAPAK